MFGRGMGLVHSRPQRPRSFWSAPRIATSGQVQHRKSAIHGLPVTLRMFRVKFDNLIGSGLSLLCLQSHSKTKCRWTRPEVAILGADQKERGLWGREWVWCQFIHVFLSWTQFSSDQIQNGGVNSDDKRLIAGMAPTHRDWD